MIERLEYLIKRIKDDDDNSLTKKDILGLIETIRDEAVELQNMDGFIDSIVANPFLLDDLESSDDYID